MITKEFVFGVEAVAYIRDQLRQGYALAHELLKLPLEAGRVTSYLPPMLRPDELLAFEDYFKPNHKGMEEYQQDTLLALRIARALSGFSSLCLLVESLYETRVGVQGKLRVPFVAGQRDLIFCLTDQYNDRLADLLGWVNDYPFVASLSLLTRGAREVRAGQPLKAELLSKVAARSDHIIVGAYDGDGYLIWTRPGVLPIEYAG